MKKRNFCLQIPRYLWENLEVRGALFGRSRNQEADYLLCYSLSVLNNSQDPVLQYDNSDLHRSVLVLPSATLEAVRSRAALTRRSVGKEIVRLLVFALDSMTKSDQEVIRKMLQKGQS